jgi:hypothetical protein
MEEQWLQSSYLAVHSMCRFVCLLSLLVLIGCGSGVAPVAINSDRAARDAMSLLDTNKNDKLDQTELQACPGLQQSMAIYDTNSDNVIDQKELAARFQGLVDAQVGQVSYEVILTLNNRPLTDATVKMMPVSFMANYLKPAEGVTDRGGLACMAVNPKDPTVQYGLYTIEVSKLVQGKETIPTRYNAKTTLGCEVGKENRGRPMTIKLQAP